MAEILSFEEMKKRYYGEWLLIAHTEMDEDMNVIRGEVLAHSSDRDEVYRAISSREGRSVAIEYVGDIPSDYAVMPKRLYQAQRHGTLLGICAAIGVEDSESMSYAQI